VAATYFALFGDGAAHAALLQGGGSALRVITLPDGCAPRQLLSAGGLGVLLCAADADASEIYVAGQSGGWAKESTVASSGPYAISQAADGTILLDGDRPLVRAPVKIGEGSAWREVAVEADDLTRRVLDGGRVLVAGHGAGDKLALYLDGGKRDALAGVTAEGDVTALSVEGRRIIVTIGTGPDARAFFVTRAGTLSPR
jgi:hypothetical protein